MATIIGSARIDEHGNVTGGKKGDQKQTTAKDDRTGEEKIIGRVDKNTFENSVIQSQKIQLNQ